MSIKELDQMSLIVIHDALSCYVNHPDCKKHCITNSKGHPSYHTDDNGKPIELDPDADGPNQHPLYIVGSEVLLALHNTDDESWAAELMNTSPFKNWTVFVQTIEKSHKQAGGI